MTSVKYYGCEDLISEAFLNILTNAIRHANDGGEIAISLISEGDAIKIIFRNTGCMIKSESLKHVFDAYYTTCTLKSGGNGLGLAIAKRVIELHGGTIYASSEMGGTPSTTFIVTL